MKPKTLRVSLYAGGLLCCSYQERWGLWRPGEMSSVFITDLDDFLAPSQACVNPLFKDDVQSKQEEEASRRGKAKITLDSLVAYDEGALAGVGLSEPDLIKATGSGKKATVTLNDCLACSGCVTTAEAVLISQQSASELQRSLQQSSYRALVIALSPQSVASLAAHYGTTGLHVYLCLRAFFSRYAQHLARPTGRPPVPVYMYSTAAASDLCLIESAAEFVARYRQAKAVPWEPPEPSRAVSSTHTSVERPGAAPVVESNAAPRHEALPLLTSACPGWVCYAEKTTPAAIPYISTTKSPQQILGTIVKDRLAPASGVAAKDVLLVGIMPCFDKKLEASRKDFYHEEQEWGGVAEVDLVLTTGEVAELVQALADATETPPAAEFMGEEAAAARAREWFLSLAPTDSTGGVENGGDDEDAMDMDAVTLASAARGLLSGVSADGRSLIGPAGGELSGSGGFVEFVFRYASRELFGVEVGPGPLTYVQGRNADYREVSLEVGGQTVLRFAVAYGFRNIQAVIQKMKRGRCPYQFVEVMACPSGCLNGGGQMKGTGPASSEAPAQAKARLERVRANFLEGRVVRDPLTESPVTRWAQLTREQQGGEVGQPLGQPALQLLHTRYHAVPKMEEANPLGIKW